MRLCGGAAYAERPAPALPHDALCRIFSFLPRGALGVTPGRVCRAWAAAKAQVMAALPALSYDERLCPFLPLWYARSVFGRVLPWQKQRLFDGAAFNGQVDVLAHYYYESERTAFTDLACYHAARAGQVGALHWLRQHGCPWDDNSHGTCNAAAGTGHLAVLQYCREQGCPWDKWTCRRAAEGGHLDVLAWLHENGCPWDEFTCHFAELGGHLAVLQYCRAHGCPWDKRTCNVAAVGGHLSVLQWCVEHGCPIDVKRCVEASHKFPACQQWLRTLLPAHE